jgi:membrane protein YqaA with SNARE-associated domain
MFLKILTVAGLATFEIYAAIPAGFAFGLSPWTIFFASVVGGLAGVFVATFLGDKIRAFFHKKKPLKDETKKHPVITRLWKKYGIAGLGIIGTITVGAPISIAVGTGLNVNLKKLLVWCCIGVLVRCSLFTIIGYYGVQLL